MRSLACMYVHGRLHMPAQYEVRRPSPGRSGPVTYPPPNMYHGYLYPGGGCVPQPATPDSSLERAVPDETPTTYTFNYEYPDTNIYSSYLYPQKLPQPGLLGNLIGNVNSGKRAQLNERRRGRS